MPALQIINGDTECPVGRADRSRPGRKDDQRGCSFWSAHLILRPVHRHSPGRRAARHSVHHQHRCRAADHRAGLQVRLPQLPGREPHP